MSEQIHSIFLGDFGEYLLTWHLRSKYGVIASPMKTQGIDLLCRDETGKLFPAGRYIAISIKTRERKKQRARDYVNVDWEKIKEASKRWDALPYYAYIRIIPELGTISFYLLAVGKAETYSKNFNVRKAESDPTNLLFEMSFNPYPRLDNW